jgi:hypothetical protein
MFLQQCEAQTQGQFYWHSCCVANFVLPRYQVSDKARSCLTRRCGVVLSLLADGAHIASPPTSRPSAGQVLVGNASLFSRWIKAALWRHKAAGPSAWMERVYSARLAPTAHIANVASLMHNIIVPIFRPVALPRTSATMSNSCGAWLHVRMHLCGRGSSSRAKPMCTLTLKRPGASC